MDLGINVVWQRSHTARFKPDLLKDFKLLFYLVSPEDTQNVEGFCFINQDVLGAHSQNTLLVFEHALNHIVLSHRLLRGFKL